MMFLEITSNSDPRSYKIYRVIPDKNNSDIYYTMDSEKVLRYNAKKSSLDLYECGAWCPLMNSNLLTTRLIEEKRV